MNKLFYVLQESPIWDETTYKRSYYKFLIFLGIYLIFNILSSFLSYDTGNKAFNIENSNKEIQKYLIYISLFPYNSIFSMILIYLIGMILVCSKKISLWFIAEEKRDFERIISIEFLSFIHILNLMTGINIFILFYPTPEVGSTYLVYIALLIGMSSYFTILYIKKNIYYSMKYLNQNIGRSLVTFFFPLICIYYILKGVL